MRVAPLGLFYAADLSACAAAAKEQALCTHADPRSGDAAAIVAVAVGLAATATGDTPARFLAALRGGLSGADLGADAHAALDALGDALRLPAWRAVRRIAALDPLKDPAWKWISPYALTTAAWALWAFLDNMGDWEGAMVAALRCGGDVDSTAAIAGAIAGARLGVRAIPDRHLGALHDGDRWRLDDLLSVADACRVARGLPA